MKATRIIIMAFALLLGLGNTMAQEDCGKAQKAPQAKETVLNKSTRTAKGYNNYQNAYKAALREAKQAYPNKEVGIRNLKEGDVKVNGDGVPGVCHSRGNSSCHPGREPFRHRAAP